MKPLKLPSPLLSSLLSTLTNLPSTLTPHPLDSPPINGFERSLVSGGFPGLRGLLPFLPRGSTSMVLSWAGQAPRSTSVAQKSPNSMLSPALGKFQGCGWLSCTVLVRRWRTAVCSREQNSQGNLSTTCGQTDKHTHRQARTPTHTHTHAPPSWLEAGQSPTTALQPQVCTVADVTSFPKLRPISVEALRFIRKETHSL